MHEVVDAFVFYAKTCFELFGDRVEMFTTFNELIVVIEDGYLYDWHYPNEINMQKGMQDQWNTVIAHLKEIREYRKLKLSGQISCILNILPSIPRSQHPADLVAAKWHDLFAIKCFLDLMVSQSYPQELKDLAQQHHFIWEILPEDEALIKDPDLKINFLGMNYYQSVRVKCVDFIPNFDNGAITLHYFYEDYVMPGRRMNHYRGW